jgi:hypothetical protein
MPYNTVLEFLNNSYPSGSYSDMPTQTIENALSSSYEEVNSYFPNVYSMPFSEPYPPMIKQGEIVIASWSLWLQRGSKPGTGQFETLQQMYYDWIGQPGTPNSGKLWRLARTQGLGQSVDQTPNKNERGPIVATGNSSTNSSCNSSRALGFRR